VDDREALKIQQAFRVSSWKAILSGVVKVAPELLMYSCAARLELPFFPEVQQKRVNASGRIVAWEINRSSEFNQLAMLTDKRV
jgi:hypothetical protein